MFFAQGQGLTDAFDASSQDSFGVLKDDPAHRVRVTFCTDPAGSSGRVKVRITRIWLEGSAANFPTIPPFPPPGSAGTITVILNDPTGTDTTTYQSEAIPITYDIS